MRFLALASMLLALVPASAPAADFEKDLQSALGSYYAALVASARGNLDQTQHHVLLFAAKWETVSREAPAAAPADLRADPRWRELLQQVGATLERVREDCRKRDVPGAHAELESIRLALRDIDSRHNHLTVDDYLTDLHDAMQRMVGHVGGPNEIVLKAKDFDDIGEDYRAAEQAWKAIESSAGSLARSDDWRAGATRVSATLAAIGRELQMRRPASLVPAIERLRDDYYTLLLAVAKARS